MNLVRDRRLRLDAALSGLTAALTALTHDQRRRLTALAASLDAMSPLKVLARGYAVVSTSSGLLVTSAKQAKAEKQLNVAFHDGSVQVQTAAEERRIQNG